MIPITWLLCTQDHANLGQTLLGQPVHKIRINVLSENLAYVIGERPLMGARRPEEERPSTAAPPPPLVLPVRPSAV